jgi:beta-galactosidase
VNFCPNSPSYRRFSVAIATKMAERYAGHPALALWHVANEYGTYCYCDNCAAEFRSWLKRKYGTIDRLNERWNLTFWGHLHSDWDEIPIPSELNDDNKWYQPKRLDYLRFMTDSTIACFNAERDAIRRFSPETPITTNMSGFIKKVDHSRFCAEQDIAAWDNYPAPNEKSDIVALKHDIARGLRGGQSYLLMEQSPNQQNWQPYNVLKRPGEVRLLSYQALAHGADSVLFFQLRRSIGGVEKLHGALIEHVGHENTRVFRESADLGRELAALGTLFVGARTPARVAILFDWENWWAVDLSSGPSKDLSYFEQVSTYYAGLHETNLQVDIVRPESDLTNYTFVIAPTLYMVRENAARNLRSFVEGGGNLIVSVFSGIVDENDLVVTGGYPGRLRDLLGIWVEEIDALPPPKTNRIVVSKPMGLVQGEYECSLLCDLIHLESAEEIAVYGEDFYAGTPCVTVNSVGRGRAYYVATNPDEKFVRDLLSTIAREAGIRPRLEAASGVEVCTREKDGEEFIFLLNHTGHEAAVVLDNRGYTNLLNQRSNLSKGGDKRLTLPPFGVAVLQTRD